MTLDEMRTKDADLTEQIDAIEAELKRRRETKIRDLEKQASALKRERKALQTAMFEAWKAL